MANVHKGWLKTRDKEYFSPNTLAESIYTRDGGKYDDAVKGYIQEAKTEFQTTQIDVQNKINDLYNKLKNIDGSDADTFYITDTNGNIILKVDAEGGHSVDFKSKNYSLEEVGNALKNIGISNDGVITAEDFVTENGSFNNLVNNVSNLQTEFIEKFKNFDTSDSDALYITDNNNNIIAKIDADGITSIDFNVPNLISYVELVELVNTNYSSLNSKIDNTANILNQEIDNVENVLNTELITINKKLENFQDDKDDALYIVDNNNNKIAQIDKDGVTSLNFNIPEGNLKNVIAGLAKEILDRQNSDNTLTAEIEAQSADIQINKTEILNLSNRLANFDGGDDTALYIVDKNNNKIAQIDANGVSSVNFISLKSDAQGNVSSVGDLNSLIKNVDNIDSQLKSFNKTEDSVKDYIDSANNTQDLVINGINDKVNTLIDKDTGKSVRTIATETLAEELIADNAKESLDTLQEIADWIQKHPDDASAMNSNITTLQNQLDGFTAEKGSVKSYIDTQNDTLELKHDNEIKTINDTLSYFKTDEEDAFYITDPDGNVVLKINAEDGLRTTKVTANNFSTPSGNLNDTISKLNTEITERKEENVRLEDLTKANSSEITNLTNKYNVISVKLEGEVSGSGNINTDTSEIKIDNTLLESITTEGSYGLTANATPKHTESFKVPYFKTDSKGRVIEAKDYTVTLPDVGNLETGITDILNKTTTLTFKGNDIDEVSTTFKLGDTKEITLELANTGVSSGHYNTEIIESKDDSTVELTHDEIITIPEFSVDEDGRLTSANVKKYQLPTVQDIKTDIADLQKKTEFIDRDPSETFYITDPNGNVIMKVDEKGVSSINFILPASTLDSDYNNFASIAEIVKILNGDKTVEGSVAWQIAEIIANADESFDTLKEIADWIKDHPNTVTELNSAIKQNETNHKDIAVKLTADITGTGEIDDNNDISITTTLSNTTVTSGTYGLTEDATPEHDDVFNVPSFTVDSKGRLTGAANHTVKLPNVKQIETDISEIKDEETSLTFKGDVDSTTSTFKLGETKEITLELTNTGVSAGDYNTNKVINVTPDIKLTHDEIITIPEFSVDEDGRLTSANVKKYQLPTVQDIKTETTTIGFNGDVDDTSITFKLGDKDKKVTLELKNTTVTADTYGPEENKELGHEDIFIVPQFTVDEDGRLTGAANKVYTLPSVSDLDNRISTNATSIEEINQKTKNFVDVANEEGLYIIDDESNKIASIDSNGISSIDFKVIDYNTEKAEFFEYGNLKDIITNVNKLIADDSDKSVRRIANEELAAQLLSDKNDADFKTLQQLADWLEEHPEDVAEINTSIKDIIDNHNVISVELTGDVLGTGTIDPETNKITIPSSLKSIVTPGTYGLTEDVEPNPDETFVVPTITIDANGRVTAAADHTVKLPDVEAITTDLTDLWDQDIKLKFGNEENAVITGETTFDLKEFRDNKDNTEYVHTIDLQLVDTGVEEGEYNVEAITLEAETEPDINLNFEDVITLPQFEVDSDGRLKSASVKNTKLPSIQPLQSELIELKNHFKYDSETQQITLTGDNKDYLTIGLDEDKIVAETDVVKANNIITDDLTLTSDILYITDNEENPNILAQFDNSGLRVTDITLYKYCPVDPENPNGEKVVVNRMLSSSMFYDVKGSIDINDDNLIFE